MKPIKLTDAELDAVFSAARPLDPDLGDPFLQAVAHALQQDCSGEIGPGTVARVCREMQRQFFDPPPCRAGRVRVAVSGPPRCPAGPAAAAARSSSPSGTCRSGSSARRSCCR